MFSTKLNKDRYMVSCLVVSENVSGENFVVDTGAKYSCCNALSISNDLREDSLAGCEMKNFSGLVSGVSIKFYKYPVKQFTIGNIDLGAQNLWITFDERVTDIILGMDLLKQVIMISNPYNQTLYFCKDRMDYEQNFHIV